MRCWKRWSAALLVLTVYGVAGRLCAGGGQPGLSVCVGAQVETLDPIYATAEGDQTIFGAPV